MRSETQACHVSGVQGGHEVREFYNLDETSDGKVAGAGPRDKGLALETEIGTVYVVAKLFDADWFIHACYDDPSYRASMPSAASC